MQIGETIPLLTFKTSIKEEQSLADYRGQWIILYFYPKDATPGCSIEARDFRDAYHDFCALNAVILGVSRDNLASHEKFKCQQELPFELISDEDEQYCQLFDVIKIKSMYGKKMRGIERSTFLINPEGMLQQAWRRVKVVGHVEEVKRALKHIQDTSLSPSNS